MIPEIATITYRSGPEWDQRFGRKFRPLPPSERPSSPTDPTAPRTPALCPDFLIETYLDHQVRSDSIWRAQLRCWLLFQILISPSLLSQGEQFCLKYDANSLIYISKAMDLFDMTLPALRELNLIPPLAMDRQSSSSTYTPTPMSHSKSHPPPVNPPPHLPDLAEGLRPLARTPTLILGVQSDILFPVEQQREVADALRMAGNDRVSYYELGGVWGHDTFL